MTEATTDRKLEYALVQSSIDRISAEVHYRFVGDAGDTIESFSEWDAACARYRELYTQYKVADKPLPLSPFAPHHCTMGVFNLESALTVWARNYGAGEFAEWCDRQEADEVAFRGCGGGCYTRCVEALARWLAEKEEK